MKSKGISVIAIHGLGTTSQTTWNAHRIVDRDGVKEQEKINWLSDPHMLPAVVPKARIWTFNYNSMWYADAPVQRLLPLAETFLAAMADVRKKASLLICSFFCITDALEEGCERETNNFHCL